MAYINQEKKAVIAAALKVALKDCPSVKYSLSIQYHMKITCRIKQGPKFLDPTGKGHIDVNTYHIDSNFEPEAAKLLNKIKECLDMGNHDNSDVQSDYFDVGWYINIEIGHWDKPYVGV
jgi:hypothetical protein